MDFANADYIAFGCFLQRPFSNRNACWVYKKNIKTKNHTEDLVNILSTIFRYLVITYNKLIILCMFVYSCSCRSIIFIYKTCVTAPHH